MWRWPRATAAGSPTRASARISVRSAPRRSPAPHSRSTETRPRRHSARSEEHTSELQSRQYLVCRLLLEKKKIDHLNRRRVHREDLAFLLADHGHDYDLGPD